MLKSAEIRDRTGLEAELTAGGNGLLANSQGVPVAVSVFNVRLNGELLFSRHETGRCGRRRSRHPKAMSGTCSH